MASSPGSWGNALRIELDQNNINQGVADAYQVPLATLFNLTVHYNGATETHALVSTATGARAQRIDVYSDNTLRKPRISDSAANHSQTI